MAMGIFYLLILAAGCPFIYFGTKLIKKANRSGLELAKYKFEHRTSGGVVEYQSWEHMQAQNAKEGRANVSAFVGILVMLPGVFLIGFAVVVFIIRS